MKFEQIEQVIEMASAGSISKAANNLYMKQPNLSMSIKNLEAELGHEIFKRSAKGVEIGWVKQRGSQLSSIGTEFVNMLEDVLDERYI